jgi:hypothetical protein
VKSARIKDCYHTPRISDAQNYEYRVLPIILRVSLRRLCVCVGIAGCINIANSREARLQRSTSAWASFPADTGIVRTTLSSRVFNETARGNEPYERKGRGGESVARKTGRAKVSTAAVLTLVESTVRELERGQTEI